MQEPPIQPRTVREAVIRMADDVQAISKNMGEIATVVKGHEARIGDLEGWRKEKTVQRRFVGRVATAVGGLIAAIAAACGVYRAVS